MSCTRAGAAADAVGMRHHRGSAVVLLACLWPSGSCTEAPPIEPWPPVVGREFPDMELLDHRGERVRLSSFAGKVLLIEPIGMSCPACVAFCGAHERGAFQGVAPQPGLGSLESYFPRFTGGLDLSHPDVMVVQMLFFDLSMGTPSVADAAAWHRHFAVGERTNHVVLIGPESIRERTMPRVPGYWLVDRDFVLRKDSTGHHPADDLYADLLPEVPELLERPAAPR